MKLFLKLSFTLLIVFSSFVQAQTEELSLDSGSIENQFEYVLQKSSKYKNNRVVKKDWLIKLKQHTLDSIARLNKNITDIKDTLEQKTNKITELETDLSNVKSNLENTEKEKSNMSFLGLQIDKGTYNVILWSIIILSLAFASFMFYRFNSSNSHTKNAKLKLAELEEEYENHRRNALEREQKVRRQLQDEIMKNKTSK